VWSSPEAAALSQPLTSANIDLMDSAYYSSHPPPSDLLPRGGSGGRSSEAEWGQGVQHTIQASGHRPSAEGLRRTARAPPRRPCAACGGGHALGHVREER
jgi:hypothetical protein